MIKLQKDIEAIKQKKLKIRKNKNKGDSYEPDSDGVTIGQIKQFIKLYYKRKNFVVKSVQFYLQKDYFVVNFGFSSKTFLGSDNLQGNGPYGLEKTTLEWRNIKREYLKESVNE